MSSTSKPTAEITASPPSPFNLTVGSEGSKSFKSIAYLIWEDIPKFAVLTGLNGAGKTQLLELIAHKLSGTVHRDAGELRDVNLTLSGETFQADEVVYIPSRWEFAGHITVGIGDMQGAKENLYNQLGQQHKHDIRKNIKDAEILRFLGISHISAISKEEFARRMPDDFSFMLDTYDVTSGLGHVFLSYRLRFAEELEKGKDRASITEEMGPAPWELVNEILNVAEFPYKVISPIETGFTERYHLRIRDSDAREINPADLSSGEKVLLGIGLWLYNSKHHGKFPKLLLLDEPDAHLHPSMARHFMSVLNEVLVNRHGVRILLTTHSPTTVSLAPEGSVFEMRRGDTRIHPSKSKQSTIGLLTAGLITVSEGTKYVFAEDASDVRFYNCVRDLLTDYGPSKDACALPPAPSLVFMPVSYGHGENRVGGGCKAVTQWVDKLAGGVLEEMFRGVIDLDAGNAPSTRVSVLGRYSIENYLLDPIVVFSHLNSLGYAPEIDGVTLAAGDEHLVRSYTGAQLQPIVDKLSTIALSANPALSDDKAPKRTVSFTNGASCLYPAWILDYRGHDLMRVYQQAFGPSRQINPTTLLAAMRRARVIPQELAQIMAELQGLGRAWSDTQQSSG